MLAKFDLASHGTYDILQKELEIVFEQVEHEIKAALPEEIIAKELEINSHVPVLNMERLAYSDKWQIVEYGITTLHPEKYRCRIKSRRAGLEVENKILLDNNF